MKSFAYCRYCLLLIKIFSHVSYVNSLYSIINLDSWWCLVLQYLSVSCLVLVVKHCLSTNLTLSKGMFLTFFFNNLYQHIGFSGIGIKSLSFFIFFWNVKGLTLNTNSKISNHLRSFSSGIKKQLSQGFESVWGLISGIGFRIMNKLKG